MILVAVAVIERADRRILIGQRRRNDSSALKWEFPGGKLRDGETPRDALARELLEELNVTLLQAVEIGRVTHRYHGVPDDLQIHFFAASIAEENLQPAVFENVAWVLPKELANYDFLSANRELIARLATGNIKPAEVLETARDADSREPGASAR